ncbi:MAG: MFS transporter [Endomicrobiia bacterium]|jgi:MFS family permease|nr:MFS transporter [Endomicrobiaceae bacterium]MDD3053065.1 MFS transporter [Endomicrobiaceae bacterium]MDD3922229.1 MFS transporter [Endomicrobiaceae bacterium]MDD5101613.1 MFS transporter [Endomicrobiaceae bacterium]
MLISNSVFKSLNIKNYRLFFFGQIISVIGSWLQMTALPWLVYSMTNSAVLLGMVAFLSQIFILIISPFAGTFADRYNRKKLLFITQSCLMLEAGILTILTMTGAIQIWHIFILSTFLGLVNAFDMTIRQSFIIDLVPKENLMNAIGLNSLIFNTGRVIGPAIAGIIIAKYGESLCFLFNTISYIAIIIALAHIIPIKHTLEANTAKFKDKLFAASNFVKGNKIVLSMLIVLAVNGIVTVFPIVLMPIFVKDVYGMTANGLGLFMSAIGVGALLATITVAGKQNTDNIQKWVFYSSLSLGFGIVFFSLITNIYSACLFLAITGYCMVVSMSLTNTYIQINAPSQHRGTVIGFFIMAFLGFTPIGSLLGGYLANGLGVKLASTLGAVITIIVSLYLKNKLLGNQNKG